MHFGEAVYRDGDYYGREVNQAARVVARAAGGEVLATRACATPRPAPTGLRFERIGEVLAEGLLRGHGALPRHRIDGDERAGAGSVRSTPFARAELVPGRPAVVLFSGGRDSTCLLDVAVELLGPGAVTALHVNYGLREAAAADERHCRALCDGSASRWRSLRPPRRRRQAGNLQAWARELRYGAGRRLAAERPRCSPAATPPTTRSRRSSTASPRRRAGARCSACARATGVLVRPLLGVHARPDGA